MGAMHSGEGNPVKVHLLGGSKIVWGDTSTHVDGRAAAILGYVALQGQQLRQRVAELFWPSVSAATARGNLRQCLRRLRGASPVDLAREPDRLSLPPNVSVDVVDIMGREEFDTRPSDGVFLEGIDFADAPELTDWLNQMRQELDVRRAQWWLAQASKLESERKYTEAMGYVEAALKFDRLLEPAHRLRIQVAYLAGDRAGALAAFEHCKQLLQVELGVSPSTETKHVADEVARGRRIPVAETTPHVALPLSFKRPPLLVGREKTWRLMKEAWEAGKGIVLAGPAGSGKTRLMQDFLSVHCNPLYFSGCPGDREIPFGTHVRTFRDVVHRIGGPQALEPWVRYELSRLLPELGDAPAHITHEAERTRFWDAQGAAVAAAARFGFDGIGFDDLQYVDPASVTVGAYFRNRSARVLTRGPNIEQGIDKSRRA
jgi:DNA-binding SARP family transcriptional activator